MRRKWLGVVLIAAVGCGGAGDTDPAKARGRALQAPDRVADSGFARLIGRRHLSALVIVASLAAALFWGAAHAFSLRGAGIAFSAAVAALVLTVLASLKRAD